MRDGRTKCLKSALYSGIHFICLTRPLSSKCASCYKTKRFLEDSDQEFEHLLKEHEKQLDEEDREKEERKAARARSVKKKGLKKKRGDDGYEVVSF